MSQSVRALKGPRAFRRAPRALLPAFSCLPLAAALNPEAPRVGLFAGLTVGVGGPRK